MKWFGMEDWVQMEGWGDLCLGECAFAHDVSVSRLNRISLDAAIENGERLWGAEFKERQWPEFLRVAFLDTKGNRMKPSLTPAGKPYED